MWRCVGCLVVVVACGAVIKPPDPDRRLNFQTTGMTFDSDRGYRFAVLPEPTARLVRLDVRYPVGSADDPPGKEGLAHLVEHLLFEVEYSVGETKTSIGAELGRLALSSNAQTHPDYTTYEVVAPPESLDALLALEVNRLAIGCGGLTADIVAREREVVINELRERHGSSGATLSKALHAQVYPANHPYRAVDSVESVSKLELSDVCSFLAGPYQRGLATVIVSGAVEGPALKQSASRAFSRARRRGPAIRETPRVVVPQPGTATLPVDIDEPMALVSWPLPPRGTREYRLLELAWREIASSIEWFAYTYSWGHSSATAVLGGDHAPVLVVGITLGSTSKHGDAIAAAKKAVQAAKRAMPAERDSIPWRRIWQARAESLLGRWESLAGRNDLAAEMLTLDPKGGFLVGRIDELLKASPDEVRKLVDEWLDPAYARFMLLEPTGSDGRATLASTYVGGHGESIGVRVDASHADQPLPVPRTKLNLAIERYRLKNGLEVILWPHGTSPLVHGRLVVGSGSAHEPIGKEGISLFADATDVSTDDMLFYSRELSNQVDDAVGALAMAMRWPGTELSDKAKGFLRGRLARAGTVEWTTYAHDLVSAAYGERHPYARAAMTEGSLAKIDRDSAVSWARASLGARNSTMILAGKFEPSLVKKHVEYNADHVASGSRGRLFDQDPEPKHQAWVRGIAKKPTPTVAVHVHFARGRGIDRDHAKRLVLEQVLASSLASLRGKHAVTYGFSAGFTPRRAGGLWTITGEVDAARAGEAATTLATVLATLRIDPESYRAEFVLARQKVLESLLLSSTDSSAIVEHLVQLVRFELEPDYLHRIAVEIARLTLKDFHPFVARELASQRQVFGAFGNAAPVDEALGAARRVK